MLMEIIVKQILRVAWFASACMFPMAAGAVTVDTGSEFWSSASSGNNFTLGTSQSFAFGTSTLTATAGTYSGTTLDLSNGNRLIDENNRGADEQGLGVCLHSCSGSPGEIDPPNEVLQISLVAAEGAGYSNFSIQANSATAGEKLEVYGSIPRAIWERLSSVSPPRMGTLLSQLRKTGSSSTSSARRVPATTSCCI